MLKHWIEKGHLSQESVFFRASSELIYFCKSCRVIFFRTIFPKLEFISFTTFQPKNPNFLDISIWLYFSFSFARRILVPAHIFHDFVWAFVCLFFFNSLRISQNVFVYLIPYVLEKQWKTERNKNGGVEKKISIYSIREIVNCNWKCSLE